MYVREEYLFFRLSYDLVNNHSFTVIHMGKNKNEIWLERNVKNHVQIVRLFQRNFDWSNHLKEDIEQVAQRIQGSKKLLPGKKVTIFNVYVATYPPVDNWESLKRPVNIIGSRPTEMRVYYLDNWSWQEEKSYLYNKLNLSESAISIPDSELEIERVINYLRERIMLAFRSHRQEAEAVFRHGKVFFTYVLLVINLIVFNFLV